MNNREVSRSKKSTLRQRRIRKHILQLFLVGFPMMVLLIGSIFYLKFHSNEKMVGTNEHNLNQPEETKETSITVSAAGDFTIGTDESFGYAGSFVEEVNKNDFPLFCGRD